MEINTNDIKTKFLEDNNIISVIKELISKNLEFEYIIYQIKQNINKDFMDIEKSVNYIKSDYQDIYIENKGYLDAILELIYHHVKLNELWMQLSVDPGILKAISRMVALWLSGDFSKDEKEQYYNEITKELKSSSVDDLVNSIKKIEEDYPDIYQYNPAYFEELNLYAKDKKNIQSITDISIDEDDFDEYEDNDREFNNSSSIKSKIFNIFKRK